jgi:hypothetical protein
MRPAVIAILALTSVSFVGCKSKQEQLTELNAQLGTLNAQYQTDCSASSSDQDANAIVGAALGSKLSPQQQAAIDQRQHEAEARKNSPHCKEVDAKRDELTKKMLATQNQ